MPDEAAAVLISLHPEFAQAIAAGTKTVELRRKFPDAAPGTWLVIYVTQPVGAVVGMVRIAGVERAPVTTLWSRYRKDVGVLKNEFDAYFRGCEEGYAVKLGERLALGPFSVDDMGDFVPGFRPPQSYRYVDANGFEGLRAGARRTDGFMDMKCSAGAARTAS
jgi:predicted transcriptional regulator